MRRAEAWTWWLPCTSCNHRGKEKWASPPVAGMTSPSEITTVLISEARALFCFWAAYKWSPKVGALLSGLSLSTLCLWVVPGLLGVIIVCFTSAVSIMYRGLPISPLTGIWVVFSSRLFRQCGGQLPRTPLEGVCVHFCWAPWLPGTPLSCTVWLCSAVIVSNSFLRKLCPFHSHQQWAEGRLLYILVDIWYSQSFLFWSFWRFGVESHCGFNLTSRLLISWALFMYIGHLAILWMGFSSVLLIYLLYCLSYRFVGDIYIIWI